MLKLLRPNFFVLLLFAALIASGVPAGAQQVTATKAPEGEAEIPLPRLILDQPRYDAGTIEAGSTISHDFSVTNQGRAPLIISEVKAGCNCIVPFFDREIAPGATGKVTITLKVYKEWAGHSLRRTAWLTTNDPISPQVRLTMLAEVRPDPSAAKPKTK